jgi:hypothetical protein
MITKCCVSLWFGGEDLSPVRREEYRSPQGDDPSVLLLERV